MHEIEKLDINSLDVKAIKAEELRTLFPGAFSEGRLDIDSLKRELGEWIDVDKERFNLNWSGKANCMKVIQQSSIGTLLPVRDDSVNFDATENLVIEGDNLEVLKLLQKSYYSKIKMIYIDPPYNTGKEFIYPDNFKEGLAEYLSRTNQVDGNGFKLSTNTETNGRFHSNWLNMMYPRLYLARNLLLDTGLIFISIDDNELLNLKKILDDIFGESNFIACLPTIMNLKGNNDEFGFAGTHEYIIVYGKNIDSLDDLGGMRLTNEDKEEYSLSDSKGKYKRGATLMRTGEAGARKMRPKGYYPIYVSKDLSRLSLEKKASDDYEVFPKTSNGKEMSWRRSPETLSKSLDEFIVTKSNDGGISFYKKQRLDEDLIKGKKPKSLFYKPEYSSGNGTEQLKQLFGERVFSNPKPLELINDLITIGLDSDGMVLDFFAGSGTTGHAVIRKNLEDGGNRKFILVQLPEKTGNPKFPTISSLTRERIKRSIEKEIGQLGDLSIQQKNGFKSFRLDSSNFSRWSNESMDKEELSKSLRLFADNINHSRTSEDLLYEVLLKAGFQLNVNIQRLTIANKEVFSVEDGVMLVCLDKNLSIEVVEGMLELHPLQIICLDESFKGNDQLKVNVIQTIKSRLENEDTKTVFRVV
jgi:adenine-specific DNA-methyltransferase